jgi:hypothetical protein
MVVACDYSNSSCPKRVHREDQVPKAFIGPLASSHNRRDNDDDQQNNDTDNQAHAHLHVLPPHLLSDPVGSPAETLC